MIDSIKMRGRDEGEGGLEEGMAQQQSGSLCYVELIILQYYDMSHEGPRTAVVGEVLYKY